MKSILLAAVFSSALVFVVGLSEEEEVHQRVVQKEDEAAAYCNSLYPVTEDIRVKLEKSVIEGETVPKDFHTSEWCNLYCNLEKLGFFDAEGKMQVRKIYDLVLKKIPKIKSTSYPFLFHLFQINRSTKDMDDECEKAYVAYYRFTEAIMAATLAAELNKNTDTSEKIVEKVLTGNLPKELDPFVEKSVRNTDFFFDLTISQNPTTRVEL